MTADDVEERVLLTGASGFVGERLATRLRELGSRISHLAVRGPSSSSKAFRDFPSVDLADSEVASRLVDEFRPTTIVHLAARSSIREGAQEPLEMWKSNFDATRNLAEAATRLIARDGSHVRMIFASSAEVYGAAFSGGPCDETSPIAPITNYGRAKAASEFMLRDLASDFFSVMVLRLFNHSGPGQDGRFVVPSLIKQVAALELGTSGTIAVGDLESERDFTDVRDVVEAYLRVIVERESAKAFAIYNVGSGRIRSVRSILDEIAALHGAPLAAAPHPDLRRVADLRRTEGIFDQFRNTFAWRPRYDFSSTIAEMLEYERNALSRSLKNV